jgi:hypothetical protein
LYDIGRIANNFDPLLLLHFFSCSKMLEIKSNNKALLFCISDELGRFFCLVGNGSVEEASIVHDLHCWPQCFRTAVFHENK